MIQSVTGKISEVTLVISEMITEQIKLIHPIQLLFPAIMVCFLIHQKSVYHRRNYLKPKRLDLRSKKPKSFAYKCDTVCLLKSFVPIFKTNSLSPLSLFTQKFFPLHVISCCRKKYFWPFVILNHVRLVLNSFFYGNIMS